MRIKWVVNLKHHYHEKVRDFCGLPVEPCQSYNDMSCCYSEAKSLQQGVVL